MQEINYRRLLSRRQTDLLYAGGTERAEKKGQSEITSGKRT